MAASASASATPTPKEDMDEEIENIISSLPTVEGQTIRLYRYEGFYFPKQVLTVILNARKNFKVGPGTVVLATLPKSGTTWFNALLFSTMNRASFDYSTHPLITLHSHDIVPHFEASNLEDMSNQRLFFTHIPYSLLPESVKSSNCPIIYVCRDLCDVFISLWHFVNKVRNRAEYPSIALEDHFESFCNGLAAYGPYWENVVDYWKASQETSNKVLFIKYEDMKQQPIVHLKKLASFIGYPFSPDEERDGVIEKIIDLCSFESMTKRDVNRGEIVRETISNVKVANNAFFRKAEVGDYKNYLTEEMIKRFEEIKELKFKPLGLEF